VIELNNQTELEKLVSFLEANSQFLQEHPSCSYIVPLTLEQLEENKTGELPEESVKNFKDHLECVWSDVTSAISTIVPVSLQLEIIRKIGELIQGFAKLIREHFSTGSYDSLDKSVGKLKTEWDESCKPLVTKVQTAIWEYKRPLGKLYKHEVKVRSDKDWKNDFIKLINTYDLMNESKQPSYLLKSGYRSFFFFSSADLTSPRIWPEFCKILSAFIEKEVDPRVRQKLHEDEARFEHVLERYSRFGLNNTIELVPVAKMHGENLGTPTLMAGLATLGFSQRDLAPPSYFGIERLRGRKPEEEEMPVVMLDDVSSRGAGIGDSIKRLKAAIGQEPLLCLLIVDRLREEISELHGVELLSMIDRSDLVESKLWEPEILMASLDDPLWSGLNLMTETIRETCKFAGESAKKHLDLSNRFSLLLEDILKIESHQGKTKILGIRVELTKDSLEMYLSNFVFICWNMLIPASFRIDEPMKFLDLVLELERNHRIVLSPLSVLLQRDLGEFVENESSFLKQDDIIHRLLVSHNAELVCNVKNKYETYLKSTMGKTFELYSEKELNDMVNETLKKTKERYTREGRSEEFEKHEKDLRDELLEAYRCFNVAFGKQSRHSAVSSSK
jgi:hypothetical protein